MAEGTARYAREAGTWFLKLAGDVRHPLGPALNALLDRAFVDKDYRQFVIDLSAAENIDSTCLGVLARIGNRTVEINGPRSTIVSPRADITEALLAVCFDRYFNLVDAAGVPVGDPLPVVSVDEKKAFTLVLEAHRRLCDLDDRNRTAFSDLVSALAAEAGQDGR
jgi:anti-anti-sigma factor